MAYRNKALAGGQRARSPSLSAGKNEESDHPSGKIQSCL